MKRFVAHTNWSTQPCLMYRSVHAQNCAYYNSCYGRLIFWNIICLMFRGGRLEGAQETNHHASTLLGCLHSEQSKLDVGEWTWVYINCATDTWSLWLLQKWLPSSVPKFIHWSSIIHAAFLTDFVTDRLDLGASLCGVVQPCIPPRPINT